MFGRNKCNTVKQLNKKINESLKNTTNEAINGEKTVSGKWYWENWTVTCETMRLGKLISD